MFTLWCLVLLSCDLPHARSLLDSRDSGKPILIPLGLQTQDPPFQVSWKKGNKLLGRIRGGQCTYGCSEVSSVLPNGSLFLSSLQREDEGPYMADVFNASGILIHRAEISLQVVDVSTDHMFDLSLENRATSHPKHVLWSKGKETVGNIFMGNCILGCNERSHVFSNGSFFLKRVQKADEGLYSALVFNASSSPIHHTDILLYVNAVTGGLFRLNLGLHGLIGGAVIGALLGIPAGLLVSGLQTLAGEDLRQHKYKEHRQLHERQLQEWAQRVALTDVVVQEIQEAGHESSEKDGEKISELLELHETDAPER